MGTASFTMWLIIFPLEKSLVKLFIMLLYTFLFTNEDLQKINYFVVSTSQYIPKCGIITIDFIGN